MEKIDQLFRLIQTVRHIRIIQLFYQIWYRIKSKLLSINWYTRFTGMRLTFYSTQCDRLLYVADASIINGNTFTFLGLDHNFEESVDWRYSGHGKLWNYNLQYGHYLLDDQIPLSQRKNILLDISQSILSGVLPLEPYPVSLRIVNTLLFLQRTNLEDQTIQQALLQQIDYLDNNLEYHLLANHLLENIYALFISAQYLRNDKLNKKYTRLLHKELENQVLADGGHYECTPMYQSILLGKLLLCLEISKASDLVSPAFQAYLEQVASRMLGWMQAYCFSDGSWAMFNDAAEGIAPTTDQLFIAAKYLGISAQEVILHESGFKKLVGKDWELVVKTGGVQPAYQPGHVHADIGSFCLWYQGVQCVIDPGISTYAIGAQRFKERGTASHNTVALGYINQSDVWSGFRVGKRAHAKVVDFSDRNITINVSGYGKAKLSFERVFYTEENILLITDNIKACANQIYRSAITASILFNPSISVRKAEKHRISAGPLMIDFNSDVCNICDAETSFRYNAITKTSRIVYKIDQVGVVRIQFR